jgi:hypothetical protein
MTILYGSGPPLSLKKALARRSPASGPPLNGAAPAPTAASSHGLQHDFSLADAPGGTDPIRGGAR